MCGKKRILLTGLIIISLSCNIANLFGETEETPTPKSPEIETPVEPLNLFSVINSEQGGQITLSDNAGLTIPPGSLPTNTNVLFQLVSDESAIPELPHDVVSVGHSYEVDLGSQTLEKPVILEIPFDTSLIPKGSEPNNLFLTYFDEQTGEWLYAGGQVDTMRNVIVLPMIHASWWQPASWNWGAWIAILSKTLRFSVVEWIEAINLLTDDCPQDGEFVHVDSSGSRNVVQGCVEVDDVYHPQLRIVNPKSFFFEIYPVSGGNGYPSMTLLSPGEDIEFKTDTDDPSPLIVTAEITQKSGWYLIVHLVITMMPGANQFGIQGQHVACITERLDDLSHFASAVGALVIDQNGAAAAESISRFMLDKDAVNRFIRAADDCNFGPAPTWSFEGIRQIGAAVSTIMSATDYIANSNYFAGNIKSQVAFNWNRSVHEQDIVQIGYPFSIYLRFDPSKWDVIEMDSFYQTEAGESVSSLQHKEFPECNIQNNWGRTLSPDYEKNITEKVIGNLDYQLETWSDPTGKPYLTVYQYSPTDWIVRIELLIGSEPDICIQEAEEVLAFSTDLLYSDEDSPTNDEPSVTNVITFSPSGEYEEEIFGSCWTYSIASPRIGFWRCSSSNDIYDPCFSLVGVTDHVICNISPFEDNQGIKMNLLEPLPQEIPPSEIKSVLAFELEDGTKCSFASTGTMIPLGDSYISYFCTDGGVIIGNLEIGQVWYAEKVIPGGEDSMTETVKVKLLKVWK